MEQNTDISNIDVEIYNDITNDDVKNDIASNNILDKLRGLKNMAMKKHNGTTSRNKKILTSLESLNNQIHMLLKNLDGIITQNKSKIETLDNQLEQLNNDITNNTSNGEVITRLEDEKQQLETEKNNLLEQINQANNDINIISKILNNKSHTNTRQKIDKTLELISTLIAEYTTKYPSQLPLNPPNPITGGYVYSRKLLKQNNKTNKFGGKKYKKTKSKNKNRKTKNRKTKHKKPKTKNIKTRNRNRKYK